MDATKENVTDTGEVADEDHGLWQKLKSMFGVGLSTQRKHATNKYGNSGRASSGQGGGYADASKELDTDYTK